ncbi:low specificity L-threonine aldolase-like [Tropilaelaps mercedesae]|uniref:Low specificity L-threonine aldolase-like n=1 Tax=Tropilaelaps mercedesae TaxID=418985 RepID=A0A1V9Y1J9_9ACAR|nr:low specificity L-threonine aldolase-like [Tropilaelaps mercedesae]
MRTRHVCDFRSDTVTKPTAEMRDAMRIARVGDDMYCEDPTVIELQRLVAELLGKEDALFFPSGTMANICATMTHCKQRGEEVLCGDMSHIFLSEQGGVSTLGGLSINPAPTQDDGRILISDLEWHLRPNENICTPRTGLLCVENTHNFKGGVTLDYDYMQQIGRFTKANRLPLHLDGARILNAATYLNCAPSDLTKYADTVMMCLSKGLGAPMGSLIAGSKDFCKQARRVRKLLGGGLRQAGVVAAAGIVALNTTAKGLYKDHEKNYEFAQKLAAFENDVFSIDLSKSQTNMTILSMKNGYSPILFCNLIDTIYPDEGHELGEEIQVRLFPITRKSVRATFHLDNDPEDVDAAVRKIKYVVEHHCRVADKHDSYVNDPARKGKCDGHGYM